MRRISFAVLALFTAVISVCAQDSSNVSNGAAARFLEQASWGPTPASIQQVRQHGFARYLQSQFSQPPSYYDTNAGATIQPAPPDFFNKAMYGPDQLRQRVAFALSEIWV